MKKMKDFFDEEAVEHDDLFVKEALRLNVVKKVEN